MGSTRRSRASSSIGAMEERVRRISGNDDDNVFDDDSSPRKQTVKPDNWIDDSVVREDEIKAGIVQPSGETLSREDEAAADGIISKTNDSADDDFRTWQMESTSTPCKKSGLASTDASATPPRRSESPEVASSYANLFSDYTTTTKTPQPIDAVDASDDFMHIEDMEESGSNLNDLVQASSQYDDTVADISKDSLGLDASVDQSQRDATISDLSNSRDKSFNSTVHQVNTKPPPMTLFSIGSSDSPDVHSSESVDLDAPQFPFSSDDKLRCGSHEGLGKLTEHTENGDAHVSSHKIWQDQDPESVISDAMKVMQELEDEEEDTIYSKPLPTHSAERSKIIMPDTSGFGTVLEGDDEEVSTPGVDLADYFDQSKSGGDRQRALSSPSRTNHGLSDYGYPRRAASIGGENPSTHTASPFLGLTSPSSLSFGHNDSLFGASEPKSSLEDLLEPSDTSAITSEWESGAKLTIDDGDVSPSSQRTGHDDLINQDANADLVKDDVNNGAYEQMNPPVIDSTISAGQNGDCTDGKTAGGTLSDNGSLESSTTAKELPSSVYSSAQSTPKHPSATAISNKMADWPGDVQTHISAELGMPENVPGALGKENGAGKPTLPKTRLPSLTTFLAQMDEATAKHASQTTLPESCVKMWAAEIVVCLSSLHSAGIICKDLRPQNILLAEGGHIRVTYFSQWKCLEQELDQYACEHFYTAPEVTGVNDITHAVDWWSLGAILYELLTSKVSSNSL